SLTVAITAIQSRLRLSGTNRLGFQPSMAISDRNKVLGNNHASAKEDSFTPGSTTLPPSHWICGSYRSTGTPLLRAERGPGVLNPPSIP
ncbi:MAG: hypothetical protein KZQ65_11190, partial [Candidatus Thiodiazotropha sp. (ex Gloverina cf. vestifex)]|nr:hypothetical protein [Candidatus Thiodiazotropha sp. (ex Gloverina cf. vestifex)]